jgi:hypothetical protein
VIYHRGMKSALVVILLGSALYAQDKCTVEFRWAIADYIEHGKGCREFNQCDSIKIENTSDKKIVDAEFGMTYLDAVGDPVNNVLDYSNDAKVKPGKDKTYIWTKKDSGRHSGSIAWVKKILFEDGSTWSDDGSKSCSSRGRGKGMVISIYDKK